MSFRMPFSGQAVHFSPFIPNRLAVASSQNFGIVGNGRLYILDTPPNLPPGAPPGPLGEVVYYDTLDSVCDCCWSEMSEGVVAAACGDGTVRLYDVAQPPMANPIRAYRGHTHEVASLSWNQVRRDSFLSASWDDTVKLWDPGRGAAPLAEFRGHRYCVYQVVWSPQNADVFLTASGDRSACVWDIRQGTTPKLTIPNPTGEVLTADWCKYDDCIVALGSVDKSIKVFDLRQLAQPLAVLSGHQFAVRQLSFSPHQASVLASCSYDMSVRLWDYQRAGFGGGGLRVLGHHTEFAIGLDFSVLAPGVVATTGWDQTVHVLRV